MASRSSLTARACPVVLAALILAPTLAPGFVLAYDMVFVPDMAMRNGFTGLGSGLPRAVPSDAVVAVLDEVVPGELLQRLVLVGALLLAGYGAQRLVPGGSAVARVAASTLYVWNPYVAERLGMGHWPVLLAYGALPWIYDAARRFRDGERTLPALALWLGLAALSISGGVMGALVALVAVLAGGRASLGRAATVGVCVLAVNLPWLVAGLLHRSESRTDPAGVLLFASDAEGLLSLPLTLLGLGGVWNTEVVPTSREGWAGPITLLIVVGVCSLGWRQWGRAISRRDRAALLVLGAVGLVVAGAGAVAPALVGELVAQVPGAGVVRDGSRYLGLLALPEAALFGFGAARLATVGKDRLLGGSLAAGAILTPVVLLPDLAWGLAGRLDPVDYPAEYAEARSVLADASRGQPGSVLLLPFAPYRLPEWNGGRRTIDPLARYLPIDSVASDELRVSGRSVAGEDPVARRVQRMLDAASRGDVSSGELSAGLRAEGIRWIAVDREAQRAVGDPDLPLVGETRPLMRSRRLTIEELVGQPSVDSPPMAERAAMAAAWTVPAVVLVGAAVMLVVRSVRRRTNGQAPRRLAGSM